MSIPVAGSRIDQALTMLKAGSDATAELLADVLWLAHALPAVNLQGSTNPEPPPPPSTREEGHVKTEIEPKPGPNVPPHPNSSPVYPPQPPSSDGPVIPATFIAVPVAEALPNRLAIERALKPFLKRFPSRKIKHLNSDKTAEASADRRVVTPIFEPSPERWFDVLLLVERSDAMEVWTDTVRELRALLDRHGAFRKVRVLRFSVRDSVLLLTGAAEQSFAARAAVDPDGRRLCLLLTNGTSDEWQRKPLIEFVGALGKRTVVAIVQMLPQKVWGHTALGDALERVRSELPGAPNAALQLEDPFSGLATRVNDSSCVPALTLEPRSIARWADFVMSSRRDVMLSIQLSIRPAAEPRKDRTPAEKLSAFRTIGSADAVRLLRILAGVVPLTLPIMRLVQQSASTSREQFHLAEVMLSGLIQRVTPADAGVPPDQVFYEFIPGVRQLLLGTLSSQESERLDELMKPVQERLRAFVEAHAHSTSRYFAALVADTEGLEQLPASARSFFEVSRRVYEGRGIQPQTSSGPAVADAAAHGPDTVPPQPSRRIGVRIVGTGLIELPKPVLYAAEQVGKAVANAGGTLIVGGWPGVDHVAARTFSQTYSENKKQLNDQLVQVVEGTQEPDFAGGNPMRVPQNQGLRESLKLADIVILIGGAGGTWQAFQEALATNKPVIPLQNTGTDAYHAAILVEIFGQNVQTDVMGAQFDTESQAELSGVRLQELIAAIGSTTAIRSVDNRELLWMTDTIIPLARTYLQKESGFDAEARRIFEEFRSRELPPVRYKQLVLGLATDPLPAWRCMAYLAIEAKPDEAFASAVDTGLGTEVQLALDHTETRPLWRCLAATDRLAKEHPEAFSQTFSVRLEDAARTISRRPRVDPGGQCKASINAILTQLRLNVTLDPAPQSAGVYEKELTAQDWYQRGLAATDPDEAIRYYNEAVRLRPEFADAFYNRAIALQEKGDLKGALQDYDETVRLNPRDADAYLNRGLMLDTLSDLDGALRAYDRAIDLYPDYADAFINRGAVRQEKSDMDGALQDYDRALRLRPDSAEIFYNRAIAHEAKGDLGRALRDYDRAIRLRPDYSDALYNRASVLYDRGQVDKALQDYDEAIRLAPGDADVYYSRAQIWAEKVAYEKAITDFEEYLKLGGGLRDGDQAEVEETIRDLRSETASTYRPGKTKVQAGASKVGRLARSHDKRVPMLHTLLAGKALEPVIPAVDYTRGMPAQLGMMMNDTLNISTCAAYYHALQVWSFNCLNTIKTQPDEDVLDLYKHACGYRPSQGGEGPGGNVQSVLTYILRNGAPYGPGGQQRHKMIAFIEVDVKQIDNIKRTIAEFGLAYIGFHVPQYIVPLDKEPPRVWDVNPLADNTIVDSHAAVLAGYDGNGARVISWGQYYTMTWAFFAKFVDEAYAIADPGWINAKQSTSGGLTIPQLEQAMQALKAS